MPGEIKREIVVLKQDSGLVNDILNEVVQLPSTQIHNFAGPDQVERFLKETEPAPVLLIMGTRINGIPLLPWAEKLIDKERKQDRDINTLVLTGNFDDKVLDAYRRFAVVLNEPFEIDDLAVAINQNIT